MAIAGYLPKRQELIAADSKPKTAYVVEPTAVFESLNQFNEEDGDLSECPECQSELTQYYEWDTVRYRCENCGMLINNQAFVKEES